MLQITSARLDPYKAPRSGLSKLENPIECLNLDERVELEFQESSEMVYGEPFDQHSFGSVTPRLECSSDQVRTKDACDIP